MYEHKMIWPNIHTTDLVETKTKKELIEEVSNIYYCLYWSWVENWKWEGKTFKQFLDDWCWNGLEKAVIYITNKKTKKVAKFRINCEAHLIELVNLKEKDLDV